MCVFLFFFVGCCEYRYLWYICLFLEREEKEKLDLVNEMGVFINLCWV